MYDNALVAIASHTMGDNGLFDSNYSPYSPDSIPAVQKPLKLTNALTSQDMDGIERDEAATCATPCPLPEQCPLSPKQTSIRRTSGRRPLSILSNSSLNSNPDLYPNLDTRSPEPWSPGRHRRHRSVIGSSVDYRAYHSPHLHQHPYHSSIYSPGGGRLSPGLYGSSSFLPPPTQQTPAALQQPQQPLQSQPLQQQQQPQQLPLQQPLQSLDPTSYLYSPPSHYPHNATSGGTSPAVSPTMIQGGIPNIDSPISTLARAQQGLQDVFVVLAYKERQVLEARQTLETAEEDLENFRHRMNSMLSPNMVPVPIRPSIISRKHSLGLNALQYTPISRTAGEQRWCNPPRVVSWRIDTDVPSGTQPPNIDEIENQMECVRQPDGVALQVIKCLLGIVRCIISTFPVQQQNLSLYHEKETVVIGWRPQYPLPMDSLYGHFVYEA